MRETILDIRNKLKAETYVNEAAVSQGIVRRLFDSLAWPVYDTDIVSPEYSLGGRRVDYALCHPQRKPRVLVEVKQVGQSVGADRQLFEYAFHKGVQMAVLTDGREWHFYLPAGEGDYSERRVYRLNILEDVLDKIESRLTRYLDYNAIRSGKAIEAAQSDYRKVAEKRQIRVALPEAWGKLVESEDDILIELLADKVESLCGIKPDPYTVAEFLRKRVQLKSEGGSPSATPAHTPLPKKSRQAAKQDTITQPVPASTGYTLYGQIRRTKSVADALEGILRELAERDPTFLERFAPLSQYGRKVQYVARSREELNPERPDLVNNAREFRPGWWMYARLSNQQKENVIKKACEVAGVRYGTDLRVNLG